ncbi:MAG: cell wall-binding repeat-containing protein, partial [Acidimicrobiales bacterium]
AAPSTDGGTTISGYVVLQTGAAVATLTTASTTTDQVSGLANGTAYSFTVEAVNAVGDSAASNAKSATPVAPPPPPPPPATTPTTTPPSAPSTSKDVSTGSSSSSTGSTGTVESKNPTTGVAATANATGEGAVTVSQLTSAPKPPPSTLTVGSLIDVRVSSASSFSKLTEKVCGAKVGTAIRWYDTSTGTWETLKPTSGPTLSTGTPPCVSFSLSSSSSPAISQLAGTAFAVGTQTVTRVFGQTADATAAAELARAFPYASGSCPTSRAAVVATTSVYQDALSSQYLARSLTTGTLLTPTERLSSVTATALEHEGITTVYVVGGPLAVTTTVVKAIEALTAYGCGKTSPSGKVVVHRLYGQTAYGTAEAVAAHVGTAPTKSFPRAYGTTNAAGGTGKYNDTAGKGSPAPAGSVPTAILASGEEFQDAQEASVVSYHTKLPLLLTPATTLSQTAVAAIEKLGIKQVILMGGPLAVTNTVEAALVAKTGVSVVRVAGKDYTDTARELARFEVAGATAGLGWTPGHRIMVARGTFFTDGMAGAVLDSPHNSATGASSARPLLLTESPTVVGTSLTTFLKLTGHTGIDASTAKTITGLTVLGGKLAVSTAVVAAMQTDLGH